jgi:hypothetical protein
MDVGRDPPAFVFLQPHGAPQQIAQSLSLLLNFRSCCFEIAYLARQAIKAKAELSVATSPWPTGCRVWL